VTWYVRGPARVSHKVTTRLKPGAVQIA